jgi:hypothetical protein
VNKPPELCKAYRSPLAQTWNTGFATKDIPRTTPDVHDQPDFKQEIRFFDACGAHGLHFNPENGEPISIAHNWDAMACKKNGCKLKHMSPYAAQRTAKASTISTRRKSK